MEPLSLARLLDQALTDEGVDVPPPLLEHLATRLAELIELERHTRHQTRRDRAAGSLYAEGEA